ncbi:Uncharacterised protein [Mycobacteroides abscessus subsp. abscessus]|nr:Uncharacterised protein [Mycobacteroides abscessus subsp. abscessus]
MTTAAVVARSSIFNGYTETGWSLRLATNSSP